MSPEAEGILKTVAISAFSSGLTVMFSLAKFRSERWWEKKVAAYERLLEAFYEAKKFSSEHLDSEVDGAPLPEARDLELRSAVAKLREEIARASDIGAFVLSWDALKLLEAYRSESDKLDEPDWHVFLARDYSLRTKYLGLLLDEARADLSGRPGIVVRLWRRLRAGRAK